MDTETRAFLEHMQETLASKSDLVALGERLEEKLIARIDRSQEELARMVNSGFTETQTQHGQTMALLHRIAEAVDADTAGFSWSQSEEETLATYRRDIDALAKRVNALEKKPS